MVDDSDAPPLDDGFRMTIQTDWFESLTGFRESGYRATRERLAIEGEQLVSLVNGARYGIGQLELVSLGQLRQRSGGGAAPSGRLRLRLVEGDVRAMHRQPECAGALFQVASQFNLLEMTGPTVRPEDGLTRYAGDPTQGPACAIAAGAATIYRNYFAPVGDDIAGQGEGRQLDGLVDLGTALSAATGLSVDALWSMQNGYALCTQPGLAAITQHLNAADDVTHEHLRGLLRLGLHRDVEVTDSTQRPGPLVSQIFCSALPVRYSGVPATHWAAFARLVLEAAYEATLCAAALNARRGASKVLMLTSLGGGAFGNDAEWIHGAMARALERARHFDLDVRLVSRSGGQRSRHMAALLAAYA